MMEKAVLKGAEVAKIDKQRHLSFIIIIKEMSKDNSILAAEHTGGI
jgi:hypothetical protein